MLTAAVRSSELARTDRCLARFLDGVVCYRGSPSTDPGGEVRSASVWPTPGTGILNHSHTYNTAVFHRLSTGMGSVVGRGSLVALARETSLTGLEWT